jgi:hypothetical protein
MAGRDFGHKAERAAVAATVNWIERPVCKTFAKKIRRGDDCGPFPDGRDLPADSGGSAGGSFH